MAVVTIAIGMAHHGVEAAPINSNDVIKARCGEVAIEEMTVIDHTKRHPFDLMITDSYI